MDPVIIEAQCMRDWYKPELALKDNLVAMFARVRRDGTPMGWAYTDEDQFRSVVGACLLAATDPDDKAWIESQLKGLALLGHAMRGAKLGVTADLSALVDGLEDAPKRDYGLMGLWHESKA